MLTIKDHVNFESAELYLISPSDSRERGKTQARLRITCRGGNWTLLTALHLGSLFPISFRIY